jgi:DNA recombination protein Rad52
MKFGQVSWSSEEKQVVQSLLEQKLGLDKSSFREGPAKKQIAYVATAVVIEEANNIFGPDGWSSSVTNLSQDFLEEDNQKYTCGCTATVKIVLKNGTYHEDVGFGVAKRQITPAKAIETAKKTAVSDGLKRALRQFGHALGNCMHSTDYQAELLNKKNNQNNQRLKQTFSPSFSNPKPFIKPTLLQPKQALKSTKYEVSGPEEDIAERNAQHDPNYATGFHSDEILILEGNELISELGGPIVDLMNNIDFDDQIFCGMLDDLQPLLPLKQERLSGFTQEEIEALEEQIEALGGMEMVHDDKIGNEEGEKDTSMENENEKQKEISPRFNQEIPEQQINVEEKGEMQIETEGGHEKEEIEEDSPLILTKSQSGKWVFDDSTQETISNLTVKNLKKILKKFPDGLSLSNSKTTLKHNLVKRLCAVFNNKMAEHKEGNVDDAEMELLFLSIRQAASPKKVNTHLVIKVDEPTTKIVEEEIIIEEPVLPDLKRKPSQDLLQSSFSSNPSKLRKLNSQGNLMFSSQKEGEESPESECSYQLTLTVGSPLVKRNSTQDYYGNSPSSRKINFSSETKSSVRCSKKEDEAKKEEKQQSEENEDEKDANLDEEQTEKNGDILENDAVQNQENTNHPAVENTEEMIEKKDNVSIEEDAYEEEMEL